MPAINPNKSPAPMPLIELMILGVMKQLSAMFEVPPERVIPISTSDRMRVAQKIQERQGGRGAMSFPQILLYLTSLNRGDVEQLYNSRQLMRAGVYTKLADNNGRIQRLHVFPAAIEMEVIFQTDNFFKGLNYGVRWLSSGLRRRLNFTVTYMDFPMDISIELSPSINVPEQDASIEVPNYYEYNSGIRVFCYLQDDEIDGTDRVQMFQQLVTAVTVTNEIQDEPKEDPSQYSTMR